MKRILPILIILTLVSCKKIPLSNGDVISETRYLNDFSVLEIYNNVDVELIESDVLKVEITSGENLIENITTCVNGNSLVIRNENICNWLRSYDCPIIAKVYYNNIYHIEYESVGNLFCADTLGDMSINDSIAQNYSLKIVDGSGDINLNFNCNILNINYDFGTSKLVIAGKARQADIVQNSYGPVHADNLIVSTLNVSNTDCNNCYVHCTENLNATIKSNGNIYYHGHPETINLNLSPDAQGRLIPY